MLFPFSSESVEIVPTFISLRKSGEIPCFVEIV